MDLTVTVGMEEPQMRQLVMLVMAIPVLHFDSPRLFMGMYGSIHGNRMLWLVGPGLGTGAPRLVPDPPRRTRRAGFPHRAPQVALAAQPAHTVGWRVSAYGSSNQARLLRYDQNSR